MAQRTAASSEDPPSPGGRPRTVAYRPRGDTWLLAGQERSADDEGNPIALREDLARCTATDLRQAMLVSAPYRPYAEICLRVCWEEYDGLDSADLIVGPVSFDLAQDGTLTLCVVVGVNCRKHEDATSLLQELLAPLLARNRMTLGRVEPAHGGPDPLWYAHLKFALRGRTLDDLYRVGNDIIELVDAARDGGLERRTAADLVRAGRADLLVGLAEGPWLDVKSEHYDLSTDRGAISLAQAVTRFCNGEQGGIVVVGMRTKRVPGGEVIRSLCPLPPDTGIVHRYETTIDRRVYPPPDGLCVESVTVPGGMLVLIDIPPQPEELKPFLVYGAIIGDHVEGAFISIVRRRGEGSIPVTAPMIHTALAAGRALLRRGELPDARQPETFARESRGH